MSALTTGTSLSGSGSSRLIGPQSSQIFRLAQKARRMGGSGKAVDSLILAGAQAQLGEGEGIGSADSDMVEQPLQAQINQGVLESRRRGLMNGQTSNDQTPALQDGVTQNSSGGMLDARLNLQRQMQAAGAGNLDQFQGAAAQLGISRSGFNQVASTIGAAPAATSQVVQTPRYPGVKLPANSVVGNAPAVNSAPTVATTPESPVVGKIDGKPAQGLLQSLRKSQGLVDGVTGLPVSSTDSQSTGQDEDYQNAIKQIRSESRGNDSVTRQSSLEALNKNRIEQGKAPIQMNWSDVAKADSAEADSAMQTKAAGAKFAAAGNLLNSNPASVRVPSTFKEVGTYPTSGSSANGSQNGVSGSPQNSANNGTSQTEPDSLAYSLGSGIRGIGKAVAGAIPSGPEIMGAAESALRDTGDGVANAAKSAVMGVGQTTDEFKSGLLGQKSQRVNLIDARKRLTALQGR